MERPIRWRVRAASAVHVVLAIVHVYWATGATWPADDQRSLSNAILGGEVSFAPRVVLPLAGLHLVLATAVWIRVSRGRRTRLGRVAHLVVLGLIAGLTARSVLGMVWVTGAGTDTGAPFYWLNLLLYTPACLLLVWIDLAIARHGTTGRARSAAGTR